MNIEPIEKGINDLGEGCGCSIIILSIAIGIAIIKYGWPF